MKIFYMIFIICTFAYADIFKNIRILKLNEPTFYLTEEEKERKYYVDAIAQTCNTQIIVDFQEKHIINFFKTAKEYYDNDMGVIATYCTYPCRITGVIQLDSKIYNFELNEGGYARLTNKEGEHRDFGDEKQYGECGI
ncbi:hypothetical protein DCO58_12585 [Helicobacter saguini]|uniref:Uncharacterized protein n=1 Tax=Helicobacter saguini TaxID=1548018 RepID=A0A099BIH9_9HELI|nr:hypothetical protein [Helicobacter saguini]MWV60880.1 hypothetical protein [Helicobacter saguini]MWV68456.1 hypothetical protein [Helicobacter saguini]MWV70084.1 hypothetical protein [Helicobacter saguini]MWV71990.1 hypothetical protein [Helicobacter saguini]TLD91351.1 hypothetical protein LS64_012075 [Helicobacter saguini]